MSLISKVKDVAAAVVAPVAEKIADKIEEVLNHQDPTATADAPTGAVAAKAPAVMPPAKEVAGAKQRPSPSPRTAKLEAAPGYKVKRGQKHRHSKRRHAS